METLITSISGALGAVGAVTFFFVILRKDIRQLAEDTRQLIQRETDRLSDDIQRLDDRLSGDIKREADRLSGDIKQVDNRLSGDIQRVDDRLREIEGDMRVVKHQLHITDDPHPAQPEQPRPVAPANPPRRRSPAPTGT